MGLSNLYIAMIFVAFLIVGFVAPFVSCLGYVWVDTFYPQYVSTLLKDVPVSLIMGSATLFSYVLLDRRSPPRITLTAALILTMAVWTTLTTTWAVAPEAAWIKWSWASKTVAFAAFIPFFIRSRVQIESFIQVFLFSCAVHILPVGIKGLSNGGGYQRHLAALNIQFGLEEGSTLAALAIMFIPLILHLKRHSLIFTNPKYRAMLYGGYTVACCAAAVATGARTAIVGFAVLGTFIWLHSRHKFIALIVLVVAALTLVVATPQAWKARMSTIENPASDQSAEGRLLVWKWTWEFVKRHPAGGGYRADTTNYIVADGVDYGTKAFHSIYFEVLGEQGYFGAALLIALILNTMITLRRVVRRTRDGPDLEWCKDLAQAMFAAFMVILACGAFIGIAFQCMLWYIFAITISLSEYVRRAQLPAKAKTWAVGRDISRHGMPVPDREAPIAAR